MRKIEKKYIFVIVTIMTLAIFYILKFNKSDVMYVETRPEFMKFVKKISSTGLVTPQNRIIVTALISGRIDKVLVEDGQVVKKKQILAWMSSQDRAALMDAVHSTGENNNAELAQMYKPTPIVAPEGGLIISKTISRGQSVGMETPLFEISDYLVFVAKVDETDIGKIAIGQKVNVRVDAFPGQLIEAKVHHILHHSSLNNNITTYDVYVEPLKGVPANLRSGMSISIDFILMEKEKAMVIPSYISEGRQNISLPLKIKTKDNTVKNATVRLGENNGEYSEVLEGLDETDTILYFDTSMVSSESAATPNLFGKKK